jgi:hypothetical protein
MSPTRRELIDALRNMTTDEFQDLVTSARPPEDYSREARRQVAAEGLRTLVGRGSAKVAAALDHDDPTERKAAARRLLHGHDLGDPEAVERRKTEAVVRLSDYQRSSLGRGTRITPGTAPSAYGNAADSITAATGLPVTHDGTGADY